MYVCLCKGITDKEIRNAVLDGAESLKALRRATDAMTQCGKCAAAAKEILSETLSMKNSDNKLFYEAPRTQDINSKPNRLHLAFQ